MATPQDVQVANAFRPTWEKGDRIPMIAEFVWRKRWNPMNVLHVQSPGKITTQQKSENKLLEKQFKKKRKFVMKFKVKKSVPMIHGKKTFR